MTDIVTIEANEELEDELRAEMLDWVEELRNKREQDYIDKIGRIEEEDE